MVYSTESITVINCTIMNSAAVNGNGGAVYSEGRISIHNTLFVNNTASNGGALYSLQSMTVTNCSIINSFVAGCGGAIYGTNVNINNGILRNTTANTAGGAVYSTNNVVMVNSSFNNCSANVGNGGGIYSRNDVTAINCTISECSALNGKGGAVYSAASQSCAISNPNLVLSMSSFVNNYATSGGVLYITGHYNHRTEFANCTFTFNNATRGGVAHVENSSLSITNGLFNDNTAATDGGVLDLSFSSVSIEHSSLSRNSASDNGGVFYGRKYSTNFTIAHSVIDHNSAENGGVFYVRRSNSNIQVIDSNFFCNSASNQSGVMDLGGVTLAMDMDTVIANNTAGSSGNVISACVSQITAYGLESRLDPVYPLYCLIYDEGSSSFTMPQSAPTGLSTMIPTTEHTETTSEGHTDGTGPLVTTTPERDTTTLHTTEEAATTIPSTSHSSSAITSMGDIAGTTDIHKVMTSLSSGTASQLFTTDSERTNSQFTDSVTSVKTQFNTDEVTIVSEEVTTAASVTQTGTGSSSISPTSNDDREGSKISDSTNDQNDLLQVAIISLIVLCIVCMVVCIMMVTFIYMACMKRKIQITQSCNKKLSQTEKGQEETHKENETQEYSFMEI